MFEKLDVLRKNKGVHIKNIDFYKRVLVRGFVFFCVVIFINNLLLINIYNLAMLYVSFLIVIIEIKHKDRYKIMCQSFLVIILGVIIYLIRVPWMHEYIQGIIQIIFVYICTELSITTLNFQELHRIMKASFSKNDIKMEEIGYNKKRRNK